MGRVPAKRHRIHLTKEEREELLSLSKQKKIAVAKYRKVEALLLCDENEAPSAKDEEVMAATGLSRRSVERLRLRCCEVGPLGALERKPHQTSPSPLRTGEVEARITALACSKPPAGEARWTLRLLAKHLVEIKVVESISHTTVGEVLKKANSNLGGKAVGVSRPKKIPPS